MLEEHKTVVPRSLFNRAKELGVNTDQMTPEVDLPANMPEKKVTVMDALQHGNREARRRAMSTIRKAIKHGRV